MLEDTLQKFVPGTVRIDDGHGLILRASVGSVYQVQDWLDVELGGCERFVDGEWLAHDLRSYQLPLDQIDTTHPDEASYTLTLKDEGILTFEKVEDTNALDRTEVLYPHTAAE